MRLGVVLAANIICSMVFINAMWFLDFAIWYNSTYFYFPTPWTWGIHYTKGDAVNLAYLILILSYIGGALSSLYLGRIIYQSRKKEEMKDGCQG